MPRPLSGGQSTPAVTGHGKEGVSWALSPKRGSHPGPPALGWWQMGLLQGRNGALWAESRAFGWGTRTFPACTRCPCRPAPAAGKSSNAGSVRNVALGCLCAFCWRVTPVNQAISHVREALLTRPSYIGAARQPQPAPGSAGASLGGWRWGWA